MCRGILETFVMVGLLGAALGAFAQREPEGPVQPLDLRVRETPAPISASAGAVSVRQITVATGTKIPLVLRQAISTKNARVGDAVYAETNFPVVQDDRTVIPAGTYVQGVISEIKKPGRIKGRAEVLFHFTTLVFPSGYTVQMPGSVENVPGAEHSRVKGPEGTVQQDGEKGKEIGTVASTAATGAGIGGLATQSGKGAGIGAGLGGATGLAIAMLTHGSDVRLERGTSVEMVLSRPLTLDQAKLPR
jgi:type IV secretion system protein VirB10